MGKSDNKLTGDRAKIAWFLHKNPGTPFTGLEILDGTKVSGGLPFYGHMKFLVSNGFAIKPGGRGVWAVGKKSPDQPIRIEKSKADTPTKTTKKKKRTRKSRKKTAVSAKARAAPATAEELATAPKAPASEPAPPTQLGVGHVSKTLRSLLDAVEPLPPSQRDLALRWAWEISVREQASTSTLTFQR